ncbi:MAG: RluA family pseudouridine synthase [Deltaproteobacteria bacterium]|nr:MAG: RluA family pseudouridine synthase [Deltaproteobacteria bacterium]
MKRLSFVADEEDAGHRLDQVLARRTPLSRRRARALLQAGAVFVDRRRVKVASRPVRSGQRVEVTLEARGAAPLAAAEPLEAHRILHSDPHLLFVDKPAGTPAQPGLDGTAASLPARLEALLGQRVYPVHRLDRDTTGVTVLARTRRAERALGAAFRRREVEKVYLALSVGVPEVASGRIEAPLGPDPGAPGCVRVSPSGRAAETAYRVLRRWGGFSLLELRPLTGRTHQIRAHLAHLGHPIAGDRRYGGPAHFTAESGQRLDFERPLLHALHLEVPHPLTGDRVGSEAPLPADLAETLQRLDALAPLTEPSDDSPDR